MRTVEFSSCYVRKNTPAGVVNNTDTDTQSMCIDPAGPATNKTFMPYHLQTSTSDFLSPLVELRTRFPLSVLQLTYQFVRTNVED
ncbi:unnamed protein product [Amoebophrya sp. A25]|nr:unnamed protein product [Amoebophrya sp. A25]|eukprot:GSA25T00009701001.1